MLSCFSLLLLLAAVLRAISREGLEGVNTKGRAAQIILIVVHVLVIAYLGYPSADPDLVGVFSGSKVVVLSAGLVVVYGVATLVSLWLVNVLYSFTYKLVARADIDIKRVKLQGRTMVIVILYCHAIALLINRFTPLSFGSASFVFALVVITVASLRDHQIHGAKRLLSGIPLYVYPIPDMLLVRGGVSA